MRTILEITQERLSKYNLQPENMEAGVAALAQLVGEQNKKVHERIHADPALKAHLDHYALAIALSMPRLAPDQQKAAIMTGLTIAVVEWEEINHEFNNQFKTA